MRLIDADAIPFRCDYGYTCMSTRERCLKCPYYVCDAETIQEQPTAYDLEKVVEELKEAKQKNYESYKEAVDTIDILCFGNVVNAYGNAIHIVRKGGVPNDG